MQQGKYYKQLFSMRAERISITRSVGKLRKSCVTGWMAFMVDKLPLKIQQQNHLCNFGGRQELFLYDMITILRCVR